MLRILLEEKNFLTDLCWNFLAIFCFSPSKPYISKKGKAVPVTGREGS
jgi:hypothetical protein